MTEREYEPIDVWNDGTDKVWTAVRIALMAIAAAAVIIIIFSMTGL